MSSPTLIPVEERRGRLGSRLTPLVHWVRCNNLLLFSLTLIVEVFSVSEIMMDVVTGMRQLIELKATSVEGSKNKLAPVKIQMLPISR